MEKCELCGDDIGTTFLEKMSGTIVKTGEGETSKKHNICSKCQAEHGDKLKKELE